METIKIKVNNLEDFGKQYFEQFNNKSTFEIVIDLETDDEFWKILTDVQYNNQLQSLKFLNPELNIPEHNKFSQFFVPEYGNIRRI